MEEGLLHLHLPSHCRLHLLRHHPLHTCSPDPASLWTLTKSHLCFTLWWFPCWIPYSTASGTKMWKMLSGKFSTNFTHNLQMWVRSRQVTEAETFLQTETPSWLLRFGRFLFLLLQEQCLLLRLEVIKSSILKCHTQEDNLIFSARQRGMFKSFLS